MKTCIKNSLNLPALIVALNLISADPVTAQIFTTLHSFTATNGVAGTNSDGANPWAGLALSGNTLYGTASAGGISGKGTVFVVKTDGTGLTSLHSFAGGDGANPYAGLIVSGNTLYGTAVGGGHSGGGTVFGVPTDGSGFTILHDFDPLGRYACNSLLDCALLLGGNCGQCTPAPGHYYCRRTGHCPGDTHGGYPYAGLILSGETLYGTAKGDRADPGTVFAVNTSGADFRNLYGFGYEPGSFSVPYAGLVLSDSTLYGTTWGDGASGNGAVFAFSTIWGGLRGVHSFTAGSVNPSGAYTNSDGATPYAGLVLSGNTLYGTAAGGGSSGYGTVFAVNTDGTGFTNLHSFTVTSPDSSGVYTNSDGATPYAGLVLSGNTLYGTATLGGASGNGTVFALNTDGTGFTTLHSFSASSTNSSGVYTNSDGALPYAGLLLSDNALYGTASQGGSFGNGTVFSISFAPQLIITRCETNVILSWPTNAVGFTLQSTTNLDSAAVWSTNFPAPIIVNGQNVVTNPTTGAQKFYRLVH
jgi:uncharacterized repeat protein (TIGR03803 family)